MKYLFIHSFSEWHNVLMELSTITNNTFKFKGLAEIAPYGDLVDHQVFAPILCPLYIFQTRDHRLNDTGTFNFTTIFESRVTISNKFLNKQIYRSINISIFTAAAVGFETPINFKLVAGRCMLARSGA